MGISRDSIHKRRATGGRRRWHRKKKKYEMGRPPSNTRLGQKRVRVVRVRGGNLKYRALRLDHGNYSWGSEAVARPTRILGVVYNASSNELVRTNTLVKNCVIQIDATPFRLWYENQFGIHLGKKSAKDDGKSKEKSKKMENKTKKRLENHTQIAGSIEEQFMSGRLLACVSSRPGQSGRADGYILEGKELEFYQKRIGKKK